MKAKIQGQEIDVEPLSLSGMHRYREYILDGKESISEVLFCRKAATVEGVKFLLNLMTEDDEDDIDLHAGNCVEVFYDLVLYVRNVEVELTGQEAIDKLKSKSKE